MAGKEAKAKEGVGDRGKLAPPERVFDYEPMNSQSGTACSLDISDEWDRDLMQFSSDAGDGFTWEDVPLKPDVIDPAVLAAAVPNFESGSSSRFSFLRILQASMQVLMHTHVGLRDFPAFHEACSTHRTLSLQSEGLDALSSTLVAMDRPKQTFTQKA